VSPRRAAEIIGAGTSQRLGGLLRHRRCALPHVQAQLLYSVRSPDDVFYRDELGEETTLTFTRRTPAGWAGATGRIDST
jgi:NAD(P)H-flavin reductase